MFLDCSRQALRALAQERDAQVTIANQILKALGPTGQRSNVEPSLNGFGVRSSHLNSELVLTLGEEIAPLPRVDPACL